MTTNKTTLDIHVYRFGDQVAINPPEGDTFYVSVAMARQMGVALIAAAKDIKGTVIISNPNTPED